MSSESTLILFGILVAITPYSGVPTFWYSYILPILGIVIIGFGFLFRSRSVSSQNSSSQTSPLSEHISQESKEQSISQTETPSSDTENPEHKDPSPIS